ncbi:MAG: DUF4870 domain-containing protein [Verrucomicrobiota bacterium]|nr:DUF4870 domain-containing protein [Verrucomicrobiota bacterium]
MDNTTNIPHPNAGTKTDLQMWQTLCHLSALTVWLFFPFANVVGPLIVWMLKRDQSPAIDAHGKEAVNFNLSLAFYLWAFGCITGVLIFFIVGLLFIPFLIVISILFPVIITIFAAIASLKSSNGEFYHYPFTIRLLK